jgi:hypothetical protein
MRWRYLLNIMQRANTEPVEKKGTWGGGVGQPKVYNPEAFSARKERRIG